MTSCCREATVGEDLELYRQVDAVARAIARDPERFRNDFKHPIKGPKLKSLVDAIAAFTYTHENP